MVFKNGVKNIQAAAYNGARMVITLKPIIPNSLFYHVKIKANKKQMLTY